MVVWQLVVTRVEIGGVILISEVEVEKGRRVEVFVCLT